MVLGILTHYSGPKPNLPLPPGEGRGEGVWESEVRALLEEGIRGFAALSTGRGRRGRGG